MHKRIIALLFIALVIFVSGCISGNTIKRQAAEPSDNATNISLADYEDNSPEAIACDCPDSFRTCGDGFNTTCENSCTNDTCSRCVPDCAGHSMCNESWFCGEWQPCSGSIQTRRCIDSSFCNKTAVIETRNCPDSCSSDADCPAEASCARYFCEGSPKGCKAYVVVPCCGDGRCEGDGDCISDCPPAPCNCSQAQCPPCNGTQNATNATNPSYVSNVSITNITYKMPEFVEIWNLGNGSADMTNWTLRDNTTLSSHIFTFPAFSLTPNVSVRVHTENGTDNTTDFFWGKNCRQGSTTGCIWNDDGDIATLKDINNNTISIYSY